MNVIRFGAIHRGKNWKNAVIYSTLGYSVDCEGARLIDELIYLNTVIPERVHNISTQIARVYAVILKM